jgi:hypothetical protein
MEVGSVWKVTGATASFFESNNIDSTKMHFLASGVFQLTYLAAGNPQTETSTWTDSGPNEVTITYDPSGVAFGQNCPAATSVIQYSISSNVLTMTDVSGDCSIANAALNNSTWDKVGGTANVIENTVDGISLFPNPASSSVVLNSTKAIDLAELKIYDLLGQEMKFSFTVLQANQLEINLADFPKGWYFVDLNAEYKERFEVK